jgi:hypothetical protein
MISSNGLTSLTYLPNGNINFSLTEEGRNYVNDPESEPSHPAYTDEDIFLEMIENHLCNGLSTIDPYSVGAMTESVLLTDIPFTDAMDEPDPSPDRKIWYFNYYMVQSYMEALCSPEGITFTLNN